jgi:hypothetical protein
MIFVRYLIILFLYNNNYLGKKQKLLRDANALNLRKSFIFSHLVEAA